MRDAEPIEIAGDVRGETQNAYRFFDGAAEVWLPKSRVTWEPATKLMTVPEWLAFEKGLI
jgi:hypothetical protein